MAKTLHHRKEIRAVGSFELQRAFAELTACDNFRQQSWFSAFAKEDFFAYADLSARPYQRLPLELPRLLRQQNLHAALQEFPGCGIAFANLLSALATATPEEPRREDA